MANAKMTNALEFVPINPSTGAMETTVIKDRPSLFCDRCECDFDERSNRPIQSTVCPHSICSRCLDAIAEKRQEEECSVDCHSCQAANAFHTKNRNINLLACAAMDLMRRHEDYRDELVERFQANVQDLATSLVKGSVRRTAGKCITPITDKVVDKDSCWTGTSQPILHEPDTCEKPAEKTKLTRPVAPMAKKMDSQVSEEGKEVGVLLEQPESTRCQSSNRPRMVWVRDGAKRQLAQLLQVQGENAKIRWEGSLQEALVGLDKVSELLHGEEEGVSTRVTRRCNRNDSARKTPINQGEVSPFRIVKKLHEAPQRPRLRSAVPNSCDQATEHCTRREIEKIQASSPSKDPTSTEPVAVSKGSAPAHLPPVVAEVVKRPVGRPKKDPSVAKRLLERPGENPTRIAVGPNTSSGRPRRACSVTQRPVGRRRSTPLPVETRPKGPVRRTRNHPDLNHGIEKRQGPAKPAVHHGRKRKKTVESDVGHDGPRLLRRSRI